jgi:hypothetical protein
MTAKYTVWPLDYAAAHTDAGKEALLYVTDNELAALRGIYQSEFQDSGNRVDHWVWVWSANPWDSTPASKKFGGVMASLNKKGLAKSDRAAGRDACVCLTALGVTVLKANEGRSL